MDNKLQVFTHENFTARTITDDNGEIWFVARDIAQAIGYSEASNTARLFQSVPEIWKGMKRIHTPGGKQEMTCLTEQGLYFFLGRSDKKAALPYQMWVAGEVVPSIRKHGFYATPQTAEQILNDPDTFIKILTALKEERAKVKDLEAACYQWQTENNALADKINEDKPKVIFAEAVSASKNSILIRELAKLIAQNGQKIGEKRLYQWLRDHDFLCKYGESRNLPQQRFVEQGLFEIKKCIVAYGDGTQKVKPTTKVTGKGQQYFIDGFLSGRFRL